MPQVYGDRCCSDIIARWLDRRIHLSVLVARCKLLHDTADVRAMNPDLIYGAFATGAVLITLVSVRKAWKDKSAGGISVWFPFYFACWGLANCFVFGFTQTPVSFIANASAIGVNLLYLYVILRNEKLEKVSQK